MYINLIFFFLLGEAIEKMLQEKKISSKINYEVLKNINNQQQRNNQELLSKNLPELDDANANNLLVYIILQFLVKLILIN